LLSATEFDTAAMMRPIERNASAPIARNSSTEIGLAGSADPALVDDRDAIAELLASSM
jgi:uncharacterized membrane protein